ncbi:MAG: TIGR01906 family membrane protein [Chloroflexi bacterium]|nr:TIGR01906 family membrane protein [Chloroflexota bacterium]MDA1002001.1 TIGR01906 family membrane protein [Chloroflexota bacterium]
MLALRWFAAALFVVSIPVFLVLSNVRIATTDSHVYDYAFSQYDVPARTGIDRPELDRAAREIVDYFQTSERGSLLDIRVTVNDVQEPLFSEREVLHMSDVRDLFRLVFRIHELAFVYAAGYIAAVFLWSRERSMLRLARQVATAGALTAGLFAIAAVAVLVGFDTLFTEFHLLSFSNDFWQLDPARDHLIQMFPEGFWFDVTLGVGVMSILEGGALTALGLGYLTWLDRDRARWRAGWPLPVPRW